jgi:hypothetical protein
VSTAEATASYPWVPQVNQGVANHFSIQHRRETIALCPIPPFATLYRTRPARLTPRVAYYLWFVIATFVDDWTSAREPDSAFRENLMTDLPRIARIHADDRFIEQLVAAAEQLRNRLAIANFSEHLVARCTAHEFIIHTALDQIIDTLNDAPEVLLFDGIDTEIPMSANDSDLERFRERLLEDADFEMLFHPAFDGIESDQFIMAEMNLAYLHPRDWFVPFS